MQRSKSRVHGALQRALILSDQRKSHPTGRAQHHEPTPAVRHSRGLRGLSKDVRVLVSHQRGDLHESEIGEAVHSFPRLHLLAYRVSLQTLPTRPESC